MVGSSDTDDAGPIRSLLTSVFSATQEKYPRLAKTLTKVGMVIIFLPAILLLHIITFEICRQQQATCDGLGFVMSIRLCLMKCSQNASADDRHYDFHMTGEAMV